MNVTVRRTTESDYGATEHVTREAFWNLYVPGCDEHYLLHSMRSHEDFIKDLDYVAVLDGEIIGNIVYTRSHAIAPAGGKIETLTFGPVSVLPEHQRKGVGSRLIDTTMKLARQMNVPAVIIYGHPYNYVKHGFVNGKRHNIGIEGEKYPSGLLVYMINKNAFDGEFHAFRESNVYNVDTERAALFDKSFPKKEKGYRPSQEDFWISAHSFIVEE